MVYKFKTIKYSKNIYRNIYTISPSQNLYDDLVDPEDYENIFELESESEVVSKSTVQANRVFDYGQSNELYIPFVPPWGEGRFGDGKDYGVFYAAEDENTSLIEAYYNYIRFIKNTLYQTPKDWIESDRKLFEIKVDIKKLEDLTKDTKNKADLIADNYNFCQKIGHQAISQNIEALRVPSVRNPKGICVPVLEKSCIIGDKFLKYVKFKYNKKTQKVYIDGEESKLPKLGGLL